MPSPAGDVGLEPNVLVDKHFLCLTKA